MRGIVIVTINRAWHDDLQRRLAVFHGADLHRRGVRPQQPIVGDENSILHIPSRMIFRKVERFKIMIIVLNVGAAGDFKAQAVKNIDNFVRSPT